MKAHRHCDNETISTVPLRPSRLEATYDCISKPVLVWSAFSNAIHSLTRPRSSGDRAVASGAMSAGSNPAEGADGPVGLLISCSGPQKAGLAGAKRS